MSDEKRDWSWLPAHMPGVRKLMAERRRTMGDAHVNLCWRRGVLEAAPGWFFAREGSLAVGVPWVGDPVLDQYTRGELPAGSVFLALRPVGVPDAQ